MDLAQRVADVRRVQRVLASAGLGLPCADSPDDAVVAVEQEQLWLRQQGVDAAPLEIARKAACIVRGGFTPAATLRRAAIRALCAHELALTTILEEIPHGNPRHR
ncbi:MAG: hypothetical protein HKL99_14140 [Burkholderiales bacterium]|nr:hypothetical protein [Burkholderiales bacterium]